MQDADDDDWSSGETASVGGDGENDQAGDAAAET